MVIVHDPLGGFPPNVGQRTGGRGGLSALKAFACSGEIFVATQVDLDLLTAWLKQVSPKMPNGSLLILDEGVMLTTADRAEALKKKFRELVATARHHKLRIAVIAQGTMLLDQYLVSAADSVAVFAIAGGYERVKMLNCGVPESIADKLPLLKDFHYYRGVPGRPASEWHYHVTMPPVST